MKPETKQNAANTIKRLRANGLSVERIASETGISFATLYRYMRGHRPMRVYLDALRKLEAKEVRQ